ncbi:MAG: Integral membrane protein MviN [Parcubacteria group bacterium GW2011_GWD1_44_9]|nr:MAG: Integral membrane protein MviN [Parcubacteria group bacterium GW2011_GWC1_43_30]KKT85851.1 MAG: Integral membrane protein MviN [Parcubacteria group bacterium GW2011_GWD1_44_9]
MVRKIFGFLYKETDTLNQAALLLGLFAFLSQVLAFLRDRLLAHIFGASTELDIYYAAFRIPDFLFVTVASVVSLSVLIPFIIEKETNGLEALRDFVSSIFSFFSVLIIVVSTVAFFLMPTISSILFKGFSPSALAEVVFISRILLLSPILLGFSNLFGSLTQAYNRFTIYALAPLLYNAGIIVGIIFLATRLGIMGVAVGVVIGASLHVLVQVPFVLKAGLFPRFSPKFNLALIVGVMKVSLPRTLTLSMSSIAMIFLVSLASLMASGSISVLLFSFNLQSVPLSIIGISYSLAAFPTLSRRFRENNLEAFRQQMATAARFIIFWSLPTTTLFIVLRAQIVRVILGSGLFDWDDTRLTAASLALFVLSSMFQCLVLLFMRGFYSAGFTRKPFFINLVSTTIMVVGTWGLVKIFYLSEGFRYFMSALLKVEDLSSSAVLMLPLGFSIATIINGLIYWAAFEREFRGFSRGVVRTFFDGLGTAVIMGATAYIGLSLFAPLLDTTSLVGIFLQGFGAGLVAILAGIVILFLLKSRELSIIWGVVHGKFWKAKVIATDPEIV